MEKVKQAIVEKSELKTAKQRQREQQQRDEMKRRQIQAEHKRQQDLAKLQERQEA